VSTDLVRLDAATLAAGIAAGEISSVALTGACLDQIAATDERYHAFLHVAADQALATAARVDASIAAGEKPASPLAGVPLALKDVFTATDMPTTCGSKILEGWVSPYDATVTARIRSAGIPILGKTNMDEFAMGSSTENSAYGPTRNPWDTDRVPGGSGGGSAAALAAFSMSGIPPFSGFVAKELLYEAKVSVPTLQPSLLIAAVFANMVTVKVAFSVGLAPFRGEPPAELRLALGRRRERRQHGEQRVAFTAWLTHEERPASGEFHLTWTHRPSGGLSAL
jgi:hypothetical protein